MTLIRYLCLLLPLAALLAAARVDRSRAGRAGALLAGIGVMVGVAAQHELARQAGWWRFAEVDGAFRGLPVDLWLAWGVLWGAVPVLLRRVAPLPMVLIGLWWLDVVAMPRMEPLLVLGPGWMVGEVLGLVLVALPAQLAGRWSADRRHLWPRVVLQMVIFSGLALWLVPTMATGGGWDWLTIGWLSVIAQLGAPAVVAVIEFARRGGGTPYPWDPPRRLVTTGPYAYVVNPMQLSMVLVLLTLAVAARSWTLAAATVSAAAFSTAVAAVHEREQLTARHGERWLSYREHVRAWVPRRRPYIAVPATLFLDSGGCTACAFVARHLAAREPAGLTLADAAAHPRDLWRARYEAADGHVAEGVAAVAHALEHLHLGWACAGWLLRVPGAGWIAQLVTDAFVAAPHSARGGRTGTCQTPSSGSSTGPYAPSANTASPVSRPAP